MTEMTGKNCQITKRGGWNMLNVYEINKRGGMILFCGGWNFSKSVSVTSRLLER